MKMKNKFTLILVMVSSSVCVQASSWTTIAQVAVPIVSGVTGYKSWQDRQDQNKFQQSLQERSEIKKEAMFEKKSNFLCIPCASKGCFYDLSIGAAVTSLYLVGRSIYSKNVEDLIPAALLSSIAIQSYFSGGKNFADAKKAANVIPSELDIESQQFIVKSQTK